MLSITRSDAGAAGAGKTESHAPGGMFARTQNIAKPNPKSFVNRKRAIDENEGTFLYKIQLHVSLNPLSYLFTNIYPPLNWLGEKVCSA